MYLLASQPFPTPRHIQFTVSRVNSWSTQPGPITTAPREYNPTGRRAVPNRAEPRHPGDDHRVCSPESIPSSKKRVPNLPPDRPRHPSVSGFGREGDRQPNHPSRTRSHNIRTHAHSPTYCYVRNKVTKTSAREPTAYSFKGVGRCVS